MRDTDYILYVGPELSCFQRRRLDSCREDTQVIYLPGLQWYEKLSADLIYDSVRTELAAHIMIERMLCSCGYQASVVYDKKQTRIDPRPGIR